MFGFFALAQAASQQPLESEHPGSIINYLWWTCGILGSLASVIVSGIAVWMLLKILSHDERINKLEQRCDDHEEFGGGILPNPKRRKTDRL